MLDLWFENEANKAHKTGKSLSLIVTTRSLYNVHTEYTIHSYVNAINSKELNEKRAKSRDKLEC